MHEQSNLIWNGARLDSGLHDMQVYAHDPDGIKFPDIISPRANDQLGSWLAAISSDLITIREQISNL